MKLAILQAPMTAAIFFPLEGVNMNHPGAVEVPDEDWQRWKSLNDQFIKLQLEIGQVLAKHAEQHSSH